MPYFIDPFHFCVALLPLAAYLMGIGAINLASRPRLLSGMADSYALGLGLIGLVMVGPMRLFLPSATAFRLGAWVWILLVAAYLLLLTLSILLSRPRLVIYNLGVEAFRPILRDVFASLDPETQWAGDSVHLPGLGVQLYVEPVGSLRNVQLIATRVSQNLDGWSAIQQALNQRLAVLPSERNRYGFTLVACGLLLVASCATWAVVDSHLVAQTFHEILHPDE